MPACSFAVLGAENVHSGERRVALLRDSEPVAGYVVGVEGCLWYLTVAGSAPGGRQAPGALMLPELLPNAPGFHTQGTFLPRLHFPVIQSRQTIDSLL